MAGRTWLACPGAAWPPLAAAPETAALAAMADRDAIAAFAVKSWLPSISTSGRPFPVATATAA